MGLPQYWWTGFGGADSEIQRVLRRLCASRVIAIMPSSGFRLDRNPCHQLELPKWRHSGPQRCGLCHQWSRSSSPPPLYHSITGYLRIGAGALRVNILRASPRDQAMEMCCHFQNRLENAPFPSSSPVLSASYEAARPLSPLPTLHSPLATSSNAFVTGSNG